METMRKLKVLREKIKNKVKRIQGELVQIVDNVRETHTEKQDIV